MYPVATWSKLRAARTGLVFRHMHELGGELRSTATAHGGRLVEVLANGSISDLEKLATLASLIQDPRQAVAPLLEFAAALKRDIETKQGLRLIAEDDLSTATWLNEICAILAGAQAQLPTGDTKPQAERAVERQPQ